MPTVIYHTFYFHITQKRISINQSVISQSKLSLYQSYFKTKTVTACSENDDVRV